MKLPDSHYFPGDEGRIKDKDLFQYLKKLLIEHKKVYEEIARVVNANDTYHKPRRVRQAAQPTPEENELMIWSDSAANKVYIVFNDADEGAKKIELI